MGPHRTVEGVGPEELFKRTNNVAASRLARALLDLYTVQEVGVSGEVLDIYGGRVHRLSRGMSDAAFQEIDDSVRTATNLRSGQLGYDERPSTDGGDTPSDEPPIPHSAR